MNQEYALRNFTLQPLFDEKLKAFSQVFRGYLSFIFLKKEISKLIHFRRKVFNSKMTNGGSRRFIKVSILFVNTQTFYDGSYEIR